MKRPSDISFAIVANHLLAAARLVAWAITLASAVMSGATRAWAGDSIFQPDSSSLATPIPPEAADGKERQQASPGHSSAIAVVPKGSQLCRLRNRGSGSYLIMPRWNPGEGVLLLPKADTDEQIFYAESICGDTGVRLVSKRSGRLIGVRQEMLKPGADVIQWFSRNDDETSAKSKYLSSNGNRWLLQMAADGGFRIVNAHSGQSLTVENRQDGGQAFACQEPWKGVPSQIWSIEPAELGITWIRAAPQDAPLLKAYTFTDESSLTDFYVVGNAKIVAGGVQLSHGSPSAIITKATYSAPVRVEFELKCVPDGVHDVSPRIFASETDAGGIAVVTGSDRDCQSRVEMFGEKIILPIRPLMSNEIRRITITVDKDGASEIQSDGAVILRRRTPKGAKLSGQIVLNGGKGDVVFSGATIYQLPSELQINLAGGEPNTVGSPNDPPGPFPPEFKATVQAKALWQTVATLNRGSYTIVATGRWIWDSHRPPVGPGGGPWTSGTVGGSLIARLNGASEFTVGARYVLFVDRDKTDIEMRCKDTDEGIVDNIGEMKITISRNVDVAAPLPTKIDPELAAPPAASDQAMIDAKIKRIFSADFARLDTQSRASLSHRLLIEAEQADSPAERFVLLRNVRDLSAKAGDYRTAADAIDRIAMKFAVQPLEMKLDALDTVLSQQSSKEGFLQFIDLTLPLIGEALAAEKFDVGERLAVMTRTASAKSGDKNAVARATQLTKTVSDQHTEFERIQEPLRILTKYPAEANANLLVGKYLCFFKGDWNRGLPMLALGSDAELKASAVAERATPSDASAQASLGDRWNVEQMRRSNPTEKRRAAERALHWYRLAESNLHGLAHTAVVKKIDRLVNESSLSDVAADPKPGHQGPHAAGQGGLQAAGRRARRNVSAVST